MALLWERFYPCLFGAVAMATYLLVPAARNYHMPESVAALMAAVVSIGGIAIGFLATAKSILISISDKDIIQKLRESGYYRLILSYMRAAIAWSFVLTLVSAGALLIDLKPPAQWTNARSVLFSIWLFLAVGSVASYYRVMGIFYRILDSDS